MGAVTAGLQGQRYLFWLVFFFFFGGGKLRVSSRMANKVGVEEYIVLSDNDSR